MYYTVNGKVLLLDYRQFEELRDIIQQICIRSPEFRFQMYREGHFKCIKSLSRTTGRGWTTLSDFQDRGFVIADTIGEVLESFQRGIEEFECDRHILLPPEAAYDICWPHLVMCEDRRRVNKTRLLVKGSLLGDNDLFGDNSNNILDLFIEPGREFKFESIGVIRPSLVEVIRKESTQAVLCNEDGKNGFKFLYTGWRGLKYGKGFTQLVKGREVDELSNYLVSKFGPVELACIILRKDDKGRGFNCITTYLKKYNASAVLMYEKT